MTLSQGVRVFIASLLVLPALASADQDLSLSIQIRPSVSATIHAKVLNNPSYPTGGRTLLIQHGLAHTGNSAKPLAEKIFSTPSLSPLVSNIVLLDLPGRGGSSLPAGMLFGDLTLEDYAVTFIESLDELNVQGVFVTAVAGHSMGGSIIELAQNRLVSQGTSLYQRFGIDRAVLLAAGIPVELPWFTADSQLGTVLALPNLRYSFTLGTYVDVPTLIWQNLFFTNSLLLYAPGTPSLSEINSEGYRSKEAYIATAELVGALGHSRPSTTAGIFGPTYGTTTRVVAHSQDRNVTVAEERSLYRYLTGDLTDQRFTTVTRFDAVHDMLISDPQALIDAGMFSDL